MSATLMVHKGAVKVARNELLTIEPPPGTDTWKPIKHADLVNTLTTVLAARGLHLRKEEYAVQREGNLLFGVMDLAWGETDEHSAALGLRTSNDKTMSIQIAIGARVFVCDNLVFSGELIALKRRHTGKLDIEEELARAVHRYEHGYSVLGKGIEQLKSVTVPLIEARELVFNVFARKIVPLKLFPKVAPMYVRDSASCGTISLWGLHNSFTTYVKYLSPGVQFEATTKLGEFFGLKSF